MTMTTRTHTTRAISALAGICLGSAAIASAAIDTEHPAGIAAADGTARRHLAAAMLPMMPAEHRAAIVAAGGIGSEMYAERMEPSDAGDLLVAGDERYEALRGVVSPALFARMSETHLESLLYTKERTARGETPRAQCFAPGTDPELIAAYELLFREQFWNVPQEGGERFNIASRWTTTATDGGFIPGQGSPITLTYSFAPDGSLADNLFGQNRTSQLFSWLNSIYGNPATWQALLDSVFEDWGDLIGVSYVYEPNDDGVEANTLPGQLGVRGDVRIFAVTLDGGFGVLAYNEFPNNGDMVFDAFDSFFNNTSASSRRLRNVASHEHGHGLGFAHSCPQNGTKLMEPSANTNFNGPQLDDILAGQRNYGDMLEPNDSVFEPTDLGTFSIGSSDFVSNVTLDDGGDVDWFRVEITQPMEFIADIQPDAGTYLTGEQNANGSCQAGSLNNFDDNLDLTLELRASNGTTVIEFENSTSFEGAEQLRASISTPGTYYLLAESVGSLERIQRYRLDLSTDQFPFDGPSIAAVSELPSAALPGDAVDVDFEILANADSITDGPDLLYRFDGGVFTRVAMTSQGGDVFRGTIPGADCEAEPEYYIEVVGDVVGAVNLPLAGAASPFVYAVGSQNESFSEDFENPDLGWNDSISTASAGDWEVATPDGLNGAPSADFDGSGQCYVTGAAANEDVDAGRVFLRTPAFDFSAGGTIEYAYYLSGGGDALSGDSLTVEVSFNQQITWNEVKSYTTDTGGWQTDSISYDASEGVDGIFFRFIAEDGGFGNTVEAAIDAVSVFTVTCEEPQGCNDADLSEPYNVLDLGDINAFLGGFTSQDPIADLAAPFGVFDLADLGAFVAAFTGGCP